MQVTADYLPVTPDEVPVKKTFTLGSFSYKFEFKYNDRFDYYMCFIYDMNDNLLYTAKIIYENDLIHAVVDGLDLDNNILPFNIDQVFSTYYLETKVDSSNLDTRVKLFVNNPVFV